MAEVILTYKLRHVSSFAHYSCWGHKKSALFGFEATPNFEWNNAGATYTTNEFGFRTHVNNLQANKNGLRIFTIGESSVFGYGLNDEQTWPHFLENALREKSKCSALDVINAGNNGFTTIQILLKLYLKVLPRKPTHIILYAGSNDPQSYRTPPEFIWITDNALFSGSLIDYWANESKGKNIYVRSLCFYALIMSVPILKDFKPVSIPEGFPFLGAHAIASSDVGSFTNEQKEIIHVNSNNFLRNVRAMYLLCKAEGVEFVLITFMQNLKDNYHAFCINYQNQLLREFAQKNGIYLIDLEKTFANVPDKESYFFPDGYHPSLKGAKFISSTIGSRLSGRLKSTRCRHGG